MLATSLTLTDGTTPATFDTVSYGTLNHTYNVAAAAYNAPQSARIAHTTEKRKGVTVKRSVFEVNKQIEDSITGEVGLVRAYLVLEVPTDIAVKADATLALKYLISAFVTTPTYNGNQDKLVNGEV